MGSKEQELGWDAAIEQDEQVSVLLPAGSYLAKITWVERGRYNGGKKLPPCNMAEITLAVDAPEGPKEMTVRLFLCRQMEWKLSEFFRAIGRKKHGERLAMNWNGLVGLPIKVQVSQKEITDRDGEQRMINEITKMFDYDPDAFPKDPDWLADAVQAEEAEPIDEVF